MITVTHINALSTYLAEWATKMRLMSEVKDSMAQVKHDANMFRAISAAERDINILLRLINERLCILETRPLPSLENIKTLDFRTDAETVVLLKALYVQVRIYLDIISGTIRFFYKKLNLPKSFNQLLKKVGKPEMPQGLTQVLFPATIWFKDLKRTRDDLVHYYEDFLLLINGPTIHHASLTKMSGNRVFDYGSIRASVGELLKNIQTMIDSLLDHFDAKFLDWYGFVQSSQSRNETIFEEGWMLYWAHRYGGYNHAELEV